MQAQTTGVTRLIPRAVLAALAAVAALLALQTAPALGATQTQTYIGDQPATPDIARGGLLFFLPSGAPGPSGIAGTINLALDGVPVVTYCLEVTRPLNETPVVADVGPRPLATPDDRAILWILENQTPRGAVTPDKQQQAAAAQVAIWLIRGQLNAANPTSDPGLNAAAISLAATARAQTGTASSLSLNATTGAGSTSATISISAKPGAVVSLSVTSGPGSLSSSSVTVGSDGKASVELTASSGGTTVSATAKGDGTLIEINPVDGSQNTAISAASQLTAKVTLSAATTVVTQARGSLSITKTAPARAKAMSKVRYRITVRNSSKTNVRNVLLRDRIPSGLSFVRASGGGALQDGRIEWTLGTLRPGAARSVSVWMQASGSVRGNRINVATVSATGVALVRAQVSTLFQAQKRRIRVAVTG